MVTRVSDNNGAKNVHVDNGRRFVLTLSCDDKPGLTAAVTGTLARHDGNILEAQQYRDPLSIRFFMRIVFDLVDTADVKGIRAELPRAMEASDLEWRIRQAAQPRRVLIMVSRFDHCLVDLLYRCSTGELNMEVVAVVSNHPREAVNTPLIGDIPFHHLPLAKGHKKAQEQRVRQIIFDTGAELIVLARYMQILSNELAADLKGKCINIHHSFLPAFKGGSPYQQAFARGVKMIGATAHYVTADLDEGPIIAQDVEHIDHADSPEELVRKGRDIERRVLASAVRYHLEDRVLLSGARKTVVFA